MTESAVIVCIVAAYRYEDFGRSERIYIEPNVPPHTWGVRGSYPLPAKVSDKLGASRCRWCLGPLPKGRRAWCGERCISEYRWRSDWTYLAGKIYTRDKGTCQLCGERKTWTEVDHVVAVRDGGSDDPDNLRLLCGYCHKTVTAEQRKKWARERNNQPIGQLGFAL